MWFVPYLVTALLAALVGFGICFFVNKDKLDLNYFLAKEIREQHFIVRQGYEFGFLLWILLRQLGEDNDKSPKKMEEMLAALDGEGAGHLRTMARTRLKASAVSEAYDHARMIFPLGSFIAGTDRGEWIFNLPGILRRLREIQQKELDAAEMSATS